MKLANKRDLVNYCNIVLIRLHYSSTAESPTGGGDPTTAVVIAVATSVVLVIILMAVVVCLCRKIRVRGDYDTGSSAHVREVYLCILRAVFVL